MENYLNTNGSFEIDFQAGEYEENLDLKEDNDE